MDRLALNKAGLIEKYLSGRFVILLNFDIVGHPEGSEDATSTDRGGAVTKFGTLALSVNPRNLVDGDSRDHKPMLVCNVELVDHPKKVVPSFVGAYFVKEESGDPRESLLYGCIPAFAASPGACGTRIRTVCTKGSYKFLPFSRKWEGNLAIPTKNGVDGVVKSASQGMYGIADRQDDFSRQWLRDQCNDLASSIRVILDHESCKVIFKEPVPMPHELRSVMIGPY